MSFFFIFNLVIFYLILSYKIDVHFNYLLFFIFVGFESQEVSITNQTELNLALVSGSTDLEELVVIGYGTQRRSHFSGASVGISAEDEKLNEIPVSRLEHALQGKLAGVQIRDQTSQVGKPPILRSGEAPLSMLPTAH